MLTIIDLFPTTRRFVANVDVIPDARHQRFPHISIYDTSRILMTPLTAIEIPSLTIKTQTWDEYVIPTTSLLHHTWIHAERGQIAQFVMTGACQFGVTQVIGMGTEPTILIRRGCHLVMSGEVWRLVRAVFRHEGIQLFYQPELHPTLMFLEIVQENVGYAGITGRYEWLENGQNGQV